MRLVKDSEGQFRDERGCPIIPRSLDDSQWGELRNHLSRYADYLTDDIRRGFDGLLTIWLHPWDVQVEDLTPSEAKQRLEAFRNAVDEARKLSAPLLSSNTMRAAMAPYGADWNDLLQHLASSRELVARTAGRIKDGVPGPKSDNAHAFVEQIDEILSDAGLSLAISDNKGRDFVGFVAWLMNVAGINHPAKSRRNPNQNQSAKTAEEMLRTYATSLIRAQVTRRNAAEADHVRDQRES